MKKLLSESHALRTSCHNKEARSQREPGTQTIASLKRELASAYEDAAKKVSVVSDFQGRLMKSHEEHQALLEKVEKEFSSLGFSTKDGKTFDPQRLSISSASL